MCSLELHTDLLLPEPTAIRVFAREPEILNHTSSAGVSGFRVRFIQGRRGLPVSGPGSGPYGLEIRARVLEPGFGAFNLIGPKPNFSTFGLFWVVLF